MAKTTTPQVIIVSNQDVGAFSISVNQALATLPSGSLLDIKYSTRGVDVFTTLYSAMIMYNA